MTTIIMPPVLTELSSKSVVLSLLRYHYVLVRGITRVAGKTLLQSKFKDATTLATQTVRADECSEDQFDTTHSRCLNRSYSTDHDLSSPIASVDWHSFVGVCWLVRDLILMKVGSARSARSLKDNDEDVESVWHTRSSFFCALLCCSGYSDALPEFPHRLHRHEQHRIAHMVRQTLTRINFGLRQHFQMCPGS